MRTGGTRSKRLSEPGGGTQELGRHVGQWKGDEAIGGGKARAGMSRWGPHPVADAVRDLLEEICLKGIPICRHPIPRGDSPERHNMRMCPLVSLDPNRPDGQKDCKCLPDLVVEPEFADCVDEDLVYIAQNIEGVALSHVPQDPNCKARAREGVAGNEGLRDIHSWQPAKGANLLAEGITE